MNFSTLDLNLLRVLDALLQTHSTVAAGQKIGLSQPAVSAALGRLRHTLEDDLFVRRGRGLEPTDYARALADPLRDALIEIERALTAPKTFDPRAATQSFRLSGSDFFAECLMPDLAADLARLAPGMRVQLVDLVPDNYVNTLERYEVDVALIPETELPPWADRQRVFQSPFVAIARADNPRLTALDPGDTVPIDLFCDMGHVLFSPEGRLQAMGDAALARVGRKRKVAMTLPFFFGVARAVEVSDLIALVPAQFAARIAPRLGLSIYTPPIPIPQAQIIMVWHRRSNGNPAHRWLRDTIANRLAALDTHPSPPR
ncbi:LysR family transcriptional regulator [Jannaschia sp. M317]|uniref:LysR family transcriptional regulator n=1 Tax=Jannaschia sp. M317 TaxID=2867011 RepID=UPI0021A85C10|nr:LysR family transcriptional regulator [Jannaschia sp. M317]UWQ16290.1 LysR family transcriptional regulator [Jannaschia sp. M317]